jgi:hypothetical protein
MTDGQVTAGSDDYELLKRNVFGTSSSDTVKVDRCRSSFVGFGLDHDSLLLNHLADDKTCSYYFIDAIERAGLVYGEILHSILYKIMTDVEFVIENGHIYDYKKNIWINRLYVGDITSEVNKVYHLASSTPYDCYALLYCKNNIDIDGDGDVDVLIRSNVLLDLDVNLNNYLYRQRTLQLLAEVKDCQECNHFKRFFDSYLNVNIRRGNDYNTKRFQLKKKLKVFYKELKKYMNENKLKEDKFMKNLCDDIYICYKTFGTKYGAMYNTARQTSQGAQRFYSATQTPEDIYDTDLFLRDHELSNFIDTPYSTQIATDIMNTVSGLTCIEDLDNTIAY